LGISLANSISVVTWRVLR